MLIDEYSMDEDPSQWESLMVGGLNVHVSPSGKLSLYELSGDGVCATLGNAADQGWAELEVRLDQDVAVRMDYQDPTLHNSEEAEPDGYVYIEFGHQEEEYPLIVVKIHEDVALDIAAAINFAIKGETE